jgi:hypothetical protein
MSANLAMIAAFLWLIAANVIGMMPSKDHHWSNAYKLIAVGVPILIWVLWTNGFLWAGLFFLGAASVLRWPLAYLVRGLRKLMGKDANSA